MPLEHTNGVWSILEGPTIQQMDARYSDHVSKISPLPDFEPIFNEVMQGKSDSGYETEDADLENWDWDIVKETVCKKMGEGEARESANENVREKSRSVFVERVNVEVLREKEGNASKETPSGPRLNIVIKFKGLRQFFEEREGKTDSGAKGRQEEPAKPIAGLRSMPRTSETRRGSRARGASVGTARASSAHKDSGAKKELAKAKAGKKRSVEIDEDTELRDAMLMPPPKRPKTKSTPKPKPKPATKTPLPPKPKAKIQASKRPGAREGTRSNPNPNTINTTPYIANATSVDAIHRLPAPYLVSNPALLNIPRTPGEGPKAAWRRLFPDEGEPDDYQKAIGVHWSMKMCFKSDVRGVDGMMGGFFERDPAEGGLMGELGRVGTRFRMEREARESQEEGGRREVESMGRGPIGEVDAAVILVMMRS